MATFKQAFAEARKAGKKTFNWNGKSYTTELAKPSAPKTSPRPAAKPKAPASGPTSRPKGGPKSSTTGPVKTETKSPSKPAGPKMGFGEAFVKGRMHEYLGEKLRTSGRSSSAPKRTKK